MARRAHPTTPSKHLFFLVFGFLALAGVGAYFFQKDANPYRTVEKLSPSDYYENANSLRGNVYQFLILWPGIQKKAVSLVFV